MSELGDGDSPLLGEVPRRQGCFPEEEQLRLLVVA